MTTELQPVKTKADYADLLAKLTSLSRSLLLTFRLEVGRLLLDQYFDGSARAFRDQNPNKLLSFGEFCKTCQDDLNDLGLSATVLRQCILARIAWDGLPAAVRDSLKFNHVVALAGVAEPNMRARLAFDTANQQWSVTDLRDAISRAAQGRYYDTDPSTPGTQPPPPKPAIERGFQPGRLVTQLVKAGDALVAWRQAWASVDAKKLRGPQRQKMVDAVAALKAQVAELEAELATAPDEA